MWKSFDKIVSKAATAEKVGREKEEPT